VTAVPLTLRLYAAAGTLLTPFAGHILRRRLARGKEHPERLGERLGRPGRARPAGFLVWLHAASVGETMSILPLIGRLAARGLPVLLTTGTVTSAELAARRLPEGALHQFVPIDLPGPVRRFLDHWRPDLALFCESELWPGLMRAVRARGVPLGIVNGRMSARSARAWQRLPGTARALLGDLALCLGQSAEDAARYRALGAPAEAIGNLKFDVPPLPVEARARAALDAAIAGRPVLLAASTHPGEEEIVLRAAERLRAADPALLTVLAPRHPGRSAEIAALCTAHGEAPAIRSLGALPGPETRIYLADTLGELGLFYALATLAFVGGSLVPVGGHNPIEPAKLGAPVLHGPEIANFRDVYAALAGAGGAIAVTDAASLAEEAGRLLAAPAARQRLADAAREVVARSEGALARTLAALAPLLPEPG
jgi:3-deoxy-D-manno-octulosonic-acid transferase